MFKELAEEIKLKLDNIVFTNAPFLKQFALDWANSFPENLKEVKRIKTTKEWWYYNDEKDDTKNFKRIEFEGPFNLNIEFFINKLVLWNPPYRYWHWINLNDKLHRDEWRKYFHQIVSHFGGNRVVYLADNTHPLEQFLYFENSFEENERALMIKFGRRKKPLKK